MLNSFADNNYRDRFTVSFLDRDKRMVKLRLRRKGWLPIPGRRQYIAETIVDGHVLVGMYGYDPDMLMHCMIRNAWNGGANAGFPDQGPRRAVIAE